MADTQWLLMLKSATKTSIVQDGKQKVHYTFTDGSEMVEEYDSRNLDLITRKLKNKATTLSGPSKWDFEIGQDLLGRSVLDSEGIAENVNNPIFLRVDSRKSFEWRIRNLPYPIDNYDVTVDEDCQSAIIRTKNKKYYKKFAIPDMKRLNLSLNLSSLHIAHANNTLIVKYEKPHEVLELERKVRDELAKAKASKDGDVQMCNPS